MQLQSPSRVPALLPHRGQTTSSCTQCWPAPPRSGGCAARAAQHDVGVVGVGHDQVDLGHGGAPASAATWPTSWCRCSWSRERFSSTAARGLGLRDRPRQPALVGLEHHACGPTRWRARWRDLRGCWRRRRSCPSAAAERSAVVEQRRGGGLAVGAADQQDVAARGQVADRVGSEREQHAAADDAACPRPRRRDSAETARPRVRAKRRPRPACTARSRCLGSRSLPSSQAHQVSSWVRGRHPHLPGSQPDSDARRPMQASNVDARLRRTDEPDVDLEQDSSMTHQIDQLADEYWTLLPRDEHRRTPT